jgi:outer membrane lipopolysaccharide assembly protein LptE/RlpB
MNRFSLPPKRFAPILWALLFAAIPAIAGCGYHLAGTTSSLPPNVKTISIPVFGNASSEPLIQNDLTQAIRQAYISDGRLKVVDSNEDLILKGNIIRYELRPVAFTSRDVASEYWIILIVDIEVIDRKTKKPYMKRQQQYTQWDYQSPPDVASSEQARQAGLRMVYRDLANRLVRLVMEKF